ncbi:hypothetical protein [Azotobacter vinelandii]|uniref:hypothetical protein n=1 Tax=Azotobacter vinelandii TaxID=354 RepID=UPI0026653203|nr:hypothetical protein [Azotobacter vinelandii]WKN24007.1 hypothetical protein AVAEIV_002145 [Azotobacter vinelandii]
MKKLVIALTLASSAALADCKNIALRNLRIVETAHDAWISATAYNCSGRDIENLEIPLLIDGRKIAIPSGHIGADEARRIWHPVAKGAQSVKVAP